MSRIGRGGGCQRAVKRRLPPGVVAIAEDADLDLIVYRLDRRRLVDVRDVELDLTVCDSAVVLHPVAELRRAGEVLAGGKRYGLAVCAQLDLAVYGIEDAGDAQVTGGGVRIEIVAEQLGGAQDHGRVFHAVGHVESSDQVTVGRGLPRPLRGQIADLGDQFLALAVLVVDYDAAVDGSGDHALPVGRKIDRLQQSVRAVLGEAAVGIVDGVDAELGQRADL